jgi:hypothetical protein
MINICKQVRFTICAVALLGSSAFAQTVQPPTAPPPTPPPSGTPTATQQDNTPGSDATATPPRISFGVRVEYFPQRFFQTQFVQTSSTNPILNSNYFASSAGAKYTLGVTGEYLLNRRLSVGADFFYHQEEYTQLDQIKSGTKDPNSSFDNRPLTSITQDTRANYWDVPVVARFYQLKSKSPRGLGWLSQTFLIGGGTYRHVSNIRTGTSTSLPDGSTSFVETPAVPVHNNLVGAVGGVGYKLFEYGKFKAMGEARYTRWFGNTFQGPGYASQKNQLEIGLSFTY